jgi:peroxiredoxin
MRRSGSILILAGSWALTACAADGTDTGQVANVVVRTAQPAPAFTLLDPTGKTFSSVTLTGKAAVVTFWAVGDNPSERQMRELIALQQQFRPEQLAVVGIVVVDNAPAVRKFVADHQLSFPVLLADLRVIEGFGRLQSIPTTFVIDKNYNIIQQYVGVADKADLKQYVEAVLKQ